MKRGIIVASFGSSYIEGADRSFGQILRRVEDLYTEDVVVESYSSGIVRGILKDRDGIEKYDTEERIKELKNQGIEDIYILSLYMVPGLEYQKSTDKGYPRTLSLLEEDKHFDKIMEALNIKDKDEYVLLVGHGSPMEAHGLYEKFQAYIWEKGFKNIFISTLEHGEREDYIEKIKGDRVRLVPFLIVAGDHAINDIFGKEDSYLSALEAKGKKVIEDRQGLGEREEIQDIFIEKLKDLVK